jgi:hypothetical protein
MNFRIGGTFSPVLTEIPANLLFNKAIFDAESLYKDNSGYELKE